jgi:hypothetical protein
MALLLATIRGDLRAAMEAEIRDVARAMRRGVERAGREVQAELRAQARGADFSDKGRALANSWRLKPYPPPGAAPLTVPLSTDAQAAMAVVRRASPPWLSRTSRKSGRAE